MNRLIYADKLAREFERHPDRWYFGRDVLREISEAETVDAVPIGRCADCKNWDGGCWCEELGCGTGGGFFCAHWEKREDGDG